MEDFSSGLILMVTGMTVVFIFLILMTQCMALMSFVANRFFPEPAVVPKTGTSGPAGEELAAITAAVHLHRRSRK